MQNKLKKLSTPTIIAFVLAILAIGIKELGILSERGADILLCAILAYVIIVLILNISDIFKKEEYK